MILSKVSAAEIRREAEVGKKITSIRKYELQEQTVGEGCRYAGSHPTHSRTAKSNSNILSTPRRFLGNSSKAEVEGFTRIGFSVSDNYDFEVVGKEVWNGRECLVLELKPKRTSKYLIVGKGTGGDTFKCYCCS